MDVFWAIDAIAPSPPLSVPALQTCPSGSGPCGPSTRIPGRKRPYGFHPKRGGASVIHVAPAGHARAW